MMCPLTCETQQVPNEKKVSGVGVHPISRSKAQCSIRLDMDSPLTMRESENKRRGRAGGPTEKVQPE